MSRIIKTSTPGKERARLSKAIVITIRAFMRHQKPDQDAKDMVAFVILALRQIAAGIDTSVKAWEKRGYWIKADKYRLEWLWSGELADQLQNAFSQADWSIIASLFVEVMQKFSTIKVSDRHRMGEPWKQAFQEYSS